MPGVLPAVTLHIAPGTATGARGHGGREGDRQRHRVPARAERRRLPPGRGEVHHEGVSEGGERLLRARPASGSGKGSAVPLVLLGVPRRGLQREGRSGTRQCRHSINAFLSSVIFNTVFPAPGLNSRFSRRTHCPRTRQSQAL